MSRRLGWALACWLPLVATAEVLDDPTRPPGYRLQAPGGGPRHSGWHLNGVYIRDGRRLALINGRLVRPGQTVGGARLVAVTPTSVRLERDGRIITLRLLPRKVKKTPKQAGRE